MQVIKGTGGKKIRSWFLRAVLLIVMVFAIFTLLQKFDQLAQSRQVLAQQQAQKANAQLALNTIQDIMRDPEQVQKDAARENGYVHPDETVVVVVPSHD